MNVQFLYSRNLVEVYTWIIRTENQSLKIRSSNMDCKDSHVLYTAFVFIRTK